MAGDELMYEVKKKIFTIILAQHRQITVRQINVKSV